ncbi:PA14 domain-containing protein [Streptomyces sp. NPDC059816]|uniref:PA14 domain-containing protein n=1 Tax=Streptomyces sp. NPDC059816 TaxID=3346960 RepID=UPI00365D05AB
MNPARRTTTASAVVFAVAGGLLTAVVPAAPAAAAPNCASPVFTRQFFANTTFSGAPKKTDCDGSVNESWSGSPARGLPKDKFGVRWTVTRDFGSGGPFSLPVEARDGIRVYVDGARKVDLWRDVSRTVKKTVNVTVPKGRHTLRVDFVNWTGPANVKFGYTPRTSASVDRVKPLVPAGPAVSYDRTRSKARISWAKNKELDLAGYRVFRRASGDAFSSRPLTTTSATSYTDTLPKAGTTYHYEVRAHDKAGNQSAGTADLKVVAVDEVAPAPVTGLAATGSTAGNRVSWKASASRDTVRYQVHASPIGSPDPDGPTLVTGTSFHDGGAVVGQPTQYRVLAVDAAGNVSAAASTTAVRVAPADVPVPEELTGKPEDEASVVAFELMVDTDGTGVGGYRLYQRQGTTDGWTAAADIETYEQRGRHTAAKAGRTQYYVVALDGQGREGAPSRTVTVNRVTPVYGTEPSRPQLTVDREGSPHTGSFVVKVKPAAADKDRKLGGYIWEFSGACGYSSWQRIYGQTGTITWQPTWDGPCMLSVRAADYYDTRAGAEAVREFMIR